MSKQKIFITGGCGYLGRSIIDKWYNRYDIIVYNRDENKQYLLKDKYPKVNFVLGDICNYERMLEVSKGCDYGVFAASLKQIDACSYNPEQAINTIINGAINSRRVAINNNFKSACFISSDKSRNPSNLYGGAKFVAGESFILNCDKSVMLNTLIYGNVFNSTGSLIVMLNNAIKNNLTLNLFHEGMTRFGIFADDAINLIDISLKSGIFGANLVPRLWSFSIKDIFEIYSEYFGLKYNVSKPRTGEKIHEILLSDNDSYRTIYNKKYNIYINYPNTIFDKPAFEGEMSSRLYLIKKSELLKTLQSKNFFQNE